ncbi:MAG: hydroxymethylglutaryl-CoA lyase [Ferruginibacter sp.]|nr:hydroxymethylglutaryl-CoA lyase [Ferruginibacter sp.]
MSTDKVKIIECPRDAMQGWPHFIPTEKKIAYLKSLLKVGFDTIDFGSFVSPKAIPQMADTKEVLKSIDKEESSSKLLAIIANTRGAEDAVQYEAIDYLGFPFSVSETFQQRNANSSIADAFVKVNEIQNLCVKNNKSLVVYISMGFGNPYGDEYNEEIVFQWADKLVGLGIRIISLADTVGVAMPEQVEKITGHLIGALTDIEIGVHLHSTAVNWKDKAYAALKAGCKRFDGALKGIGGCPMAGNDLVGNMNTELMLPYFKSLNLLNEINEEALNESMKLAAEIFI